MLKLLGVLCLLGGATAVGFGAEGQLNRRVKSLRSLRDGLAWMERELSFRLTPLPDLLQQLAEKKQIASRFFQRCRESLPELGKYSMGELWSRALAAEEDLLLQPEELAVLLTLGDVLGRYDSQGQQEALQVAVNELSQRLTIAEEEKNRLGKLYRVLGISAGALSVIVLL